MVFFDFYYSGCQSKLTLQKLDWKFIIRICIIFSLSLSSFIFPVSKNLNTTNVTMPKEFQLHSIIFAMRSFLIILIIYLFKKSRISQISIIGIIFLTMILADYATKYTKDPNKQLGIKVTNIPYWTACPIYLRNTIRNFYAFIQILFTSLAFTHMIEIHIMAMFIIQCTALLFTLGRKGIISFKMWHILYLLEYLMIFIAV